LSAEKLFSARGYSSGRGRCKHLDKGVFGGYICKLGHQIESITPRISNDMEICKDKEVSKSA
jgi:hypothetical protein